MSKWQGKSYPLANIHDLSGAITHKKEIITLYLQGHLTPTIAAKTKHSKEAVDRYIRDYESVKVVEPLPLILTTSHTLHDSKRVISQYLDLFPGCPVHQQTITKEKLNDTITPCSLSKTGAVSLKIPLTVGYRVCYTLDISLIISRRKCQRNQLNPLIAMTGKLIDISIPAIIRSFDTISLSTFFW